MKLTQQAHSPEVGAKRYLDALLGVHAAEPAKAEKWVSQLWLHEGPYPPCILDDNPHLE